LASFGGWDGLKACVQGGFPSNLYVEDIYLMAKKWKPIFETHRQDLFSEFVIHKTAAEAMSWSGPQRSKYWSCVLWSGFLETLKHFEAC
jgi:hypothetical protein